MSEVDEVQERIKADIEALKEQMATMMEAMMSMKKIMEVNAATFSELALLLRWTRLPHLASIK